MLMLLALISLLVMALFNWVIGGVMLAVVLLLNGQAQTQKAIKDAAYIARGEEPPKPWYHLKLDNTTALTIGGVALVGIILGIL